MKTLIVSGFFLILSIDCWAAELPRILIDTRYVPATCDVTITSATSFQTTIDAATCGQTICLTAGNTWTGPFVLPNKDCTDTTWVVIRTTTSDSLFPQGRRVTPSQASLMAKLTAGAGTTVLENASGADHYRLVGLEITPTASVTAVIDLSNGSQVLATQANHITIDRCWIHGHATAGSRRTVSGQGAYIAVIDSHLSDAKDNGTDAQGFASWSGSGPFKIVNNHIEGSGQSIMFGGAPSPDATLNPKDIEIRRNHLIKPLSWKADDPSYDGLPWANKNLFELKAGQRVLFENNLLEQNWLDAQTGAAVLFTPTSDSGGSWSLIEDVNFRGNWFRKSAQGFNVQGEYPGGGTVARVTILNNLVTEINSQDWSGGDRRLTTSFTGPDDVHITHNSLIPDTTTDPGYIMYADVGPAATGYQFKYNIVQHGYGGFSGSSSSCHIIFTDDVYFTSPDVSSNIVQGAVAAGCGSDLPGNTLVTNLSDIGFVNLGTADYRLDPTSSYDTTADAGSDPGAWIPSATAAASQLDWNLTLQGNGTNTGAIVTFGVPGLPFDQSCAVRVGASTTTSATGPSRRSVVVTGLTNGQEYFIGVDCGTTWGGAMSYVNFAATTPSGGDRTIPIQIAAPPSFLSTAERCTLQYDDNAAMSTPTSVPDTTCSTGSTLDITAPAGVQYYRVLRLTSGDVEVARTGVQSILVQ